MVLLPRVALAEPDQQDACGEHCCTDHHHHLCTINY
jgi:hypothetical protein